MHNHIFFCNYGGAAATQPLHILILAVPSSNQVYGALHFVFLAGEPRGDSTYGPVPRRAPSVWDRSIGVSLNRLLRTPARVLMQIYYGYLPSLVPYTRSYLWCGFVLISTSPGKAYCSSWATLVQKLHTAWRWPSRSLGGVESRFSR